MYLPFVPFRFYNRPWDRTYGNNPEADFDYHGGPSGYIQSRLWGGNMSGNNSEGGYYDDGGRSEYSRKRPWSTGMLDDKPGSSFDRARWESNQKLGTLISPSCSIFVWRTCNKMTTDKKGYYANVTPNKS